MIPEPMADILSIICMSRKYFGLAKVHYDILFHKQTALKADTKWSIINLTL